MGCSKKDIDKVQKKYREQLALLEAKCKEGNATKEEYKLLNKLREKKK